VSPTVIQAVVQTRMDDFVRAADADRRRHGSETVAARDATVASVKPRRPRRRLRLGFA